MHTVWALGPILKGQPQGLPDRAFYLVHVLDTAQHHCQAGPTELEHLNLDERRDEEKQV